MSEPLKPVMPCVVMSNTIHAYMSQSDKGELVIGAGTDAYVSYSQTGGLHIASSTLEAICEMFPIASRVRMMRNWGGIVDTTPDRSPIIGKTPVPGLFVNCGWGTGGFKATPGSGHLFAHQMATGEPHPIAAPFCARPVPLRRARQRSDRGRRRALKAKSMLLIRCPYCEMERPEVEFKYGGEAHLTRPDPNAASDEEWTDFLYFRANTAARTPNAGATPPAAAGSSTACATR